MTRAINAPERAVMANGHHAIFRCLHKYWMITKWSLD